MKILTSGNYYGNQNAEVLFNGALLSQYSYTSDLTDWHYHENPYFMYILQGNMMDSNKKVKTLCPSGSLMFNNWQEPHFGSKHSKDANGFHLEFERKWLKENDLSLSLLEGSQLVQNPKVHLLFAKLYAEFILSDCYSEIAIEILLIQICEAISDLKKNHSHKTPDWISGLKELLHYSSSNLNLQYLSDQLGVHPVHISRVAPKHLSMNLGEYIRQDKIKKSIPLLLDSDFSLTEISYQLGFSDQSHFNRVFKALLNKNPSSYRKKLKKF